MVPPSSPAVLGVQVEIVSALDHANELYVVVAGEAAGLLFCALSSPPCQSLPYWMGQSSWASGMGPSALGQLTLGQ
jgi:hypothetical protein